MSATPNLPRWPWAAVVALAALGLAFAIYLEWEHYLTWTVPAHAAICDFSEGLSCTAVARSEYAVFPPTPWGIPVAFWGILGYLLFAGVALWAWFSGKDRPAAALLGILSGFSVVTSAALGLISELWIGTICPFCAATYLVNGLLFVLALLVLRQLGFTSSLRSLGQLLREDRRAWFLLGGAGTLVMAAVFALHPRYWNGQAHDSEPLALPAPAPSASATCVDCGPQTGVTAEGHWWIGARNPQVTVEEFSDYQCPFCARAHQEVRVLLASHPGVVRLVHRHFPLDSKCNPLIQGPFHDAACYYAALATCAGEQRAFWAVNDYLFQHGHDPNPVKPEQLAAKFGLDRARLEGCLKERAWASLKKDLEKGIELDIKGTPTFVINGQVRMGDPKELLAPFLTKEPAGPGSAHSAPPATAGPAGAVSGTPTAPSGS